MEYKVINKQNNSRDCVICGLRNSSSLKTQFFELENKTVAGIFMGREEHQSYNNRMHGGMISAILDETIGRAMQINNPDIWAVTGELKIRFKKPVPLGVMLKAVGKITAESSRSFTGVGFIEDEEGNLLATASGMYVKLPIETIAEGGMSNEDWFCCPLKQDPKAIDVKNMDILDRIN